MKKITYQAIRQELITADREQASDQLQADVIVYALGGINGYTLPDAGGTLR